MCRTLLFRCSALLIFKKIDSDCFTDMIYLTTDGKKENNNGKETSSINGLRWLWIK